MPLFQHYSACYGFVNIALGRYGDDPSFFWSADLLLDENSKISIMFFQDCQLWQVII